MVGLGGGAPNGEFAKGLGAAVPGEIINNITKWKYMSVFLMYYDYFRARVTNSISLP